MVMRAGMVADVAVLCGERCVDANVAMFCRDLTPAP